MCLWATYKKKYEEKFFLHQRRKESDPVPDPESGSISQRYGFGETDPHQNDTDPQHWFEHTSDKKEHKAAILKSSKTLTCFCMI